MRTCAPPRLCCRVAASVIGRCRCCFVRLSSAWRCPADLTRIGTASTRLHGCIPGGHLPLRWLVQ